MSSTRPDVGEAAQPAQQPGPALRAGQVADRSRTARPARRGGRASAAGSPGVRRRQPRLAGRRDLRDELQALEHPGREHRPDHRRERREVPVRRSHSASASESGGSSGPSRADPRRDRPELGPCRRRRHRRRPSPHRARSRSPAARPARTARARPRRPRASPSAGGHEVGVGPRARARPARRRPPRRGARPCRPGASPRSSPSSRHARLAPQPIRIRRSALRRFSCSMIASISAAVRSTSPVSLTTTWS